MCSNEKKYILIFFKKTTIETKEQKSTKSILKNNKQVFLSFDTYTSLLWHATKKSVTKMHHLFFTPTFLFYQFRESVPTLVGRELAR